MIKLLYGLLLGVPITLGKQIVHAVADEVKREGLMTEESIKAKLQQMQLLLQDGTLSEDEYEALETELIRPLREVRESQRS